jgi:hypothetical protein
MKRSAILAEQQVVAQRIRDAKLARVAGVAVPLVVCLLAVLTVWTVTHR